MTLRLKRSIVLLRLKGGEDDLQIIKTRVTLKTAREMRKMTQEEAAKSIGISTDTLGNYERGKSYPDIPVLRKIEALYGVPYEQLIFLPLDYDKTVNMI